MASSDSSNPTAPPIPRFFFFTTSQEDLNNAKTQKIPRLPHYCSLLLPTTQHISHVVPINSRNTNMQIQIHQHANTNTQTRNYINATRCHSSLASSFHPILQRPLFSQRHTQNRAKQIKVCFFSIPIY